MTDAQAKEIAPTDFDFIIGDWNVAHSRLRERLVGCDDWIQFAGTSKTRKILGGFGNVEDNFLELPDGRYRAAAIRSYDLATRLWAIWWLDARNPGELDVPVMGGFQAGVGVFYSENVLNGKAIRVRFTWSVPEDGCPLWDQAFSPDAGDSWETNWTMRFTRAS